MVVATFWLAWASLLVVRGTSLSRPAFLCPDEEIPEDDISCGAITIGGHHYKDVSKSYTRRSGKKCIKCVGRWDGCIWPNMAVNNFTHGAIQDGGSFVAIVEAAKNTSVLKWCFLGNKGELDKSDNYIVHLFDPK